MFSLSELAPLNQHQNRSKLLKPWWEVFMDYLVVLMLMTSIVCPLPCLPPHAPPHSPLTPRCHLYLLAHLCTFLTPSLQSLLTVPGR
uniref:LRRC8 pannexin-like TM region domain-containing protein n=1 Tax=Echeneis naucrates TaxID=173247 RepID=A0A665WLH4_ECHNA